MIPRPYRYRVDDWAVALHFLGVHYSHGVAKRRFSYRVLFRGKEVIKGDDFYVTDPLAGENPQTARELLSFIAYDSESQYNDTTAQMDRDMLAMFLQHFENKEDA